ncbi:TPA: HNH endonuclease [Vibrio parahaemolyticus]|uniref:HNH endonuclease n=1 Tax=Vibrio parahaemolyticus TaxID=670 RepID=UPI001A26B310|nr:HNH endonuclease [Vibrio parahaemolyticus]HAS6350087.1 hypothetical protein [Vibrio vulnificus]HCE3018166.1 HNH endonuclease [Vibrio parahaemolyticus]HCE4478274.1 HNH endonuclease [Vibrio parahaemolyticus]
MAILEQVEELLAKSGQEFFSSTEIKNLMAETYGTNPNSVLPPDYCYNRTNNGIDKSGMLKQKFLIRIESGQYRYVGFDYKFNGYVYQKPHGSKVETIVGFWKDGIYSEVRQPENDLEDLNGQTFIEGSTKQVTVNTYERNSAARQKCLDFHGYNCKVCDFDFAEVYGEIGKGFIHVHHIVQIANIKREYELDPVKDLVPLCPNCHAMVHRHNPAMHPDELRERLCQKNV